MFRAQEHDIVGARAPMGSFFDDMTGLLVSDSKWRRFSKKWRPTLFPFGVCRPDADPSAAARALEARARSFGMYVVV